MRISIFFIGAAFGGSLFYTGSALAAEATLDIQVSIMRCVTQEERRAMCVENGLCCNLLEGNIDLSLSQWDANIRKPYEGQVHSALGDDHGDDYSNEHMLKKAGALRMINFQ